MLSIIKKFMVCLCVTFYFGCTEEKIPTEDTLTQTDAETQKSELNAKKPDNPGGGNGGGGGGGKGPTVYLTGDGADVTTNTTFGIALMGGADAYTTAETAAFEFLTSKSGGGDFVVLRSSGSDGYNDFIYTDIGGVNSVETIIVDSRKDADHTTTETLVRNAEAIFIAGGDQSDYVNYWKDTKLEAALDYVINTKKAPIGGTSAGLAILGEYYYGAFGGSITSSEALADPYHRDMDGLEGGGFLNVDYLDNLITDSHYGERGRQGRHFTFMARIIADYGISATQMKGVGVDEATAVLVEANGSSQIYGDGNAYFLIGTSGGPEVCTSNTPLTWDHNSQAVSAYVVPGTSDGSNTFDFSNWNGNGGTQEYWSAIDGNFVRN